MICDFTAQIAVAEVVVEGPWRGWAEAGEVIAQTEVRRVEVMEARRRINFANGKRYK